MARISALFVVLLAACGGGEAMPDLKAPGAGPSSIAAPTTTAASAEKITSLKRSQVQNAIRHGVGMFLRNVEVDEWPAMKNGKFYGWRVKAINPDWILDLMPGDVVLRINGMPIEHPEEADAALKSLDTAPSLKVDIERNGQPRTLELPINGD
jgi:type II secretory pathway component PulC